MLKDSDSRSKAKCVRHWKYGTRSKLSKEVQAAQQFPGKYQSRSTQLMDRNNTNWVCQIVLWLSPTCLRMLKWERSNLKNRYTLWGWKLTAMLSARLGSLGWHGPTLHSQFMRNLACMFTPCHSQSGWKLSKMDSLKQSLIELIWSCLESMLRLWRLPKGDWFRSHFTRMGRA